MKVKGISSPEGSPSAEAEEQRKRIGGEFPAVKGAASGVAVRSGQARPLTACSRPWNSAALPHSGAEVHLRRGVGSCRAGGFDGSAQHGDGNYGSCRDGEAVCQARAVDLVGMGRPLISVERPRGATPAVFR